MLKKLDLAAGSLLVVGGLNWLSVGAGRLDLVSIQTFRRPDLVHDPSPTGRRH